MNISYFSKRSNFFMAFLGLLILAGFSQKEKVIPKECDYSGCVGDVKYSVLPLESFQDLNGNGWILSSGQIVSDTALATYSPYLGSKIHKVPDIRGNFIRAMNLNGGNDPFEAEESRVRQVGEYQRHAFYDHQHSISQAKESQKRSSGGTRVQSAADGLMIENLGTPNSDGASNSPSKYETRPVNISLYCYIKIK